MNGKREATSEKREVVVRAQVTMALAMLLASLFSLLPPLAAQSPITVMTFNIRYGTANDGAHAWPNRREHVIATIRDSPRSITSRLPPLAM